jgi:molybdopterin-biosynthesis enzyme MoeA-like protein
LGVDCRFCAAGDSRRGGSAAAGSAPKQQGVQVIRTGGMGRTRDEMMKAATAEIRRVRDVLWKLETDLAHAVEHAEQTEDETFDTQEQAAAISRRMEIAE